MNIHEVLTYGSVVASNEDLDILITVNGAYYNIWCGDYLGNYTNTDCRATDFDGGLYGQDFVKVADKAQEILEEILSEGDEEDEDEE
jgi:hypothetical protein